MEELKNDIEVTQDSVKVTCGYEFGLSSDSYAKDKAILFVSATISSGEYSQEEALQLAKKRIDWLVENIEEDLVKRGKERIEALADLRIEEVRKQYEESYQKLLKEYLKLKDKENAKKNNKMA